MKIAVLNFSGNVGKSTIARHLLLPRIPGAELIAIESINAADEHQGQICEAVNSPNFRSISKPSTAPSSTLAQAMSRNCSLSCVATAAARRTSMLS